MQDPVNYFDRVKVYLRILMTTPPIISDFASVIQTSLAPVFLLAGTAGFVNIYTTRLGRVSDRLNEVAERLERNETSRAARLSTEADACPGDCRGARSHRWRLHGCGNVESSRWSPLVRTAPRKSLLVFWRSHRLAHTVSRCILV